jgi:transcriptional regulator with XRE-family HTH domain
MNTDSNTTDSGTRQATLHREEGLTLVEHATDEDRRVRCPDCGADITETKGGQPEPGGRRTHGWRCTACENVVPCHCYGPEAPQYNDQMEGVERAVDGETRYIPVVRVATDGGVPDSNAFRIPTVAELDAMRVEHGLSQRELSRRAGVEEGRFHHILQNDIDPQTETMRSFLSVLQNTQPQTEDELASKRGPKPKPSPLADSEGVLTWDDVEPTAPTEEEFTVPENVSNGELYLWFEDEVVDHEENCAACGVNPRLAESKYCNGCDAALTGGER